MRLGQFLVPFHQLGDAGGLGGGFDIEAVGLHDGAVIGLMRLAQLRRHGGLVVEIGEGAIGVQRPRVEDRLRGLLDFGFMRLCWIWPWEVVVNYGIGVEITHFYRVQEPLWSLS